MFFAPPPPKRKMTCSQVEGSIDKSSSWLKFIFLFVTENGEEGQYKNLDLLSQKQGWTGKAFVHGAGQGQKSTGRAEQGSKSVGRGGASIHG